MSRVDMSSTVTADFCANTVTIRSNPGSYNTYGEWVAGTPSDRSVTGSFQKATPKELVQLDLGEIKQEVRKLLAPNTEEILISEDDDKRSDRLIYQGRRYKAVRVGDNSDFGFYRAFFAYEGDE